MDYYYQVLVEKKLPFKFLTYSSKTAFKTGQVVEVPIRNKPYLAIIISEVKELTFDPQKAKSISLFSLEM